MNGLIEPAPGEARCQHDNRPSCESTRHRLPHGRAKYQSPDPPAGAL